MQSSHGLTGFRSKFNALHYNLSIRTKYISAFLLVSILSITILTMVAMPIARNRLIQQIGVMLHHDAEGEGRAVGDMLVRQVDRLETFGLDTAMLAAVVERNAEYPSELAAIQARLAARDQQWISAGDQQAVGTDDLNAMVVGRLQAYQAAFPDHVEVFITDQYGGLVGATQRPSDYYQADEAWWQAAWNNGLGSVYLGQPAWDDSSQTFAMIVAVPIRDTTSAKVVGVLRSTYRLADVVNNVEAARWGATGRAKVVLPNGQYLTNGEQAVAIEGDLLRRVSEQAATVDVYEGVPRLLSRAPVVPTMAEDVVTQLGWIILLHQDQQESFMPVTSTIRTSVWAALCAVLVSSILAVFFAQRSSTPLKTLSGAVERFADGDYSQRVELRRGDELGVLSQRFNHMAMIIAAQTQGLQTEIARADAARVEADAARAKIARQFETIEKQHTVIREMSVPVLPLSDTTLVMPLVGNMDRDRLQLIQTRALEAIEKSRARYLLLDVTGVSCLDALVAESLIQLVQAARLLGTEVILVGIRPDVAQSIVALGIDLSRIVTRTTLQSGLAQTQTKVLK